MKVSDLFVKCLENEGVEYIFGVPGEENEDLLFSLEHSNNKLKLTYSLFLYNLIYKLYKKKETLSSLL